MTCAREYGLELKMKQGTERGELRAFCEKHGEVSTFTAFTAFTAQITGSRFHFSLSQSSTQSATRKMSRIESSLSLPPGGADLAAGISGPKIKSFKSKQAYNKRYTQGPPIVPAYVFDRVSDYIDKLKIARKTDFMNAVCRYWSLKREARRGAPFLKRLHLEVSVERGGRASLLSLKQDLHLQPWTASGSTQQATEHEKAKKLELMRLVRNDLEKVRMLTERVRKREKKKLARVNVIKAVIDTFVFPKDKKMREVLDQVAA